MDVLLEELARRWSSMFRSLAEGEDLPPGPRLRAEGMMEAALLLGPAGADQIIAVMDDCYRGAFGRGLAQDFGEDWREFYPFPQIPAVMHRAPVFPSTKE